MYVIFSHLRSKEAIRIHTQVTYVHHIPEGRIIGFDCGIQSPYLHHIKPTIKVNNLYYKCNAIAATVLFF